MGEEVVAHRRVVKLAAIVALNGANKRGELSVGIGKEIAKSGKNIRFKTKGKRL